jgi:hypothetical protein
LRAEKGDIKMIKKDIMFVFVGMALLLPISDIEAQPIYDIPVTPLYQRDYEDKIDNSGHTIATMGCTLTAWTMDINYAINVVGLHTKKPDGSMGDLITYTPADINRLLNEYRYEQKTYKKDESGKYVKDEKGRYIVERIEIKNGWGLTIGADGKPIGSATEINMGALFKAVQNDTRIHSFEGKSLKQESYRAPGWSGIPSDIGRDGVVLDPNYLRILEELESGRPVVVRVANDTHSVLVTSYHGEEGKPKGSGRYDIKDPQSNTIVWLDHYGNKIYGWDTGVFKAGGLHNPFEVPSDYYIDPILLTDPEINPEYYGSQVFLESYIIPEPASFALVSIGLFMGFSMHFLIKYLRRRRFVTKADCQLNMT